MTTPAQPDPSDPLLAAFLREMEANPDGMRDELARAGPADLRGLVQPPAASAAVDGNRPPPAVGVGSQLGEYRLVRKINEGGMGVVYEAVKPGRTPPDERFAVKVLRPDVTIPEADERFREEMVYLKALGRARNVVPLLADGRDGGVCYMVMPLVASSLRDHLKNRGSRLDDWWLVADVVRQIANALTWIKGVNPNLVHGDLTPENVLLESTPETPDTPFGVQALVSDFGLAIIASTSPSGRRRDLCGKYQYFSPDFLRSAEVLTPQSDLFTLGVVAYELLTGRCPFEDAGDSVQNVIDKIRIGKYTSIHTLRPGMPRDLVDLIDRLLCGSPLGRGQPADVVNSLDRLLERRSAEAHAGHQPPILPGAAAGHAPSAAVSPQDRGVRGGRGWVIAALGLVSAAVVWSVTCNPARLGTQVRDVNAIAGRVLDVKTGAAVADAEVRLVNCTQTDGQTPTTRTDSHGRYRFETTRPDWPARIRVRVEGGGFRASETEQVPGELSHVVGLDR